MVLNPALNNIVIQARAVKTHLCDMVESYLSPLWPVVPSGKDLSATHIAAHIPTSPQHSIYMINLVDKKGVQGRLGTLWQSALTAIDKTNTTSVFRRFGYFRDRCKENNVSSGRSDGLGVDEGTRTLSSGEKEEQLDRSATSHSHKLMNVTLQDLVRLSAQNTAHTVAPLEEEPHIAHDTNSMTCTPTTISVPVDANLLWFDYHHRCKRNSESVIDIFRIIQAAISTGGGFATFVHSAHNSVHLPPTMTPSETHIVNTQQHIIRTNCMDCLDRTNVMQSVVSRWVLLRQLASLEAIASASSASSGVESAPHSGEVRLTADQLKADQSSSFVLPDKVIVPINTLFMLFLLISV